MSVLRGLVNLFRFDKTNWRAVTLCTIAATVFWFFNALNKEHTATISYPVEFQFDKQDFIPVRQLPKNVLLNITGSGWELLRKSLGYKIAPLHMALEKPTDAHTVSPATILALASTQLGQTKINHVASDTLVLSIEPRLVKKVKLIVNEDELAFDEKYGLSTPVVILPDSVQLTGPASILSKTTNNFEIKLNRKSISRNVKDEIDLENSLGELVIIEPDAATVMFEVSERQEVQRRLKIVMIPAPPYKYQTLEDSVTANFRVPAKSVGALDSLIGIYAVIDLKSIKPGVMKVLPEIKGTPPFSEILSVDSVTVRKF